MWDSEKENIDDLLNQHILTHPPALDTQVGDLTLIQHITSMPVRTGKEQFECLSSISNFHRMPYPDGNSNSQRIIDPKEHVGYNRHILHSVGHTNPTSPRNRLMYYLTMDESFVPSLLVRRYLQVDKQDIEITAELDTPAEDLPPPRPRKKRKHQSRSVSVTLKDICKETGQDMNTLLNCSNQNRGLYNQFKEQLRMEGCIKWRHHDESTDVCIMSDYNSTNGNIMPSSFVHVTSEMTHGGPNIVSCTCEIYKHLQGIAYHQNLGPATEDLYPDITMTCMHCRYFSEELKNAYDTVMQGNADLPWALQEIHDSLQHMNSPIQLAGSVIPRGTTKFSVKGEGKSIAFVNITFQQEKCYAKCTGGICSIELQGKKRIPRLHAITETPNLCGHMKAIVADIEYIKDFFPWHFKSTEEILHNEAQNEEVNTDDLGLKATQINFDVESGLWDYPAVTKHKPKQMRDPDLTKHTELRNKFSTSGKLDPSTGLRIYQLKPNLRNEEGTERRCECGEIYEEAGYKKEMDTVLYTRISALKCISYNLHCPNGSCHISYKEPAEQRGLFFFTAKTAVADEVAWDFVRSVQKMKTSFRGFCNEMTTRYETNQMPAYPFMSGNTFINFFFAWLSAFKIDFRKEIDPKCGYNPKILACDGTHIGVSSKNMNLQHPITEAEIDEELQSVHRRKGRALIPDYKERGHLKYFCKKFLKKLKADKQRSVEEEEMMLESLLQTIRNMNHPALTQAIEYFFNRNTSDKMRLAMAKVLIMLSGDAPMLSVFPFRSHPILRDIINSLVSGNGYGNRFPELKKYCCETSALLSASVAENCINVTVSLILYLIQRIEFLHLSRNRPTPEVDELENSYDPRKGIAYYFTANGNQLRKMPKYQQAGHRNFDDPPEVDLGCTKNFPGVSYGGFGYIFLWFCPIHGHSYGFHLIAGGEGRKDPFSSLYKYKPDAPEEVFYDNACQLHEYCLNREPKFFMNTRFWHDLFHSIGHVCGCNYKSRRVVGLEAMNTEICEQVNSFLQCIKYTGSHLSQEHFCFFMQFFLYLLNKEKTAKLQKLTTVAVAGHL